MKPRLIHIIFPLVAMVSPLIVHAACTPAANPDLNHDGTVGLHDQTIVALSYGLPADNPRFNPIADTNCDGKVDTTDILFVRNAFGQTFPVAPEVGGIIKIWGDIDLRIDKKEMLNITLAFSTKDRSRTPFTLRVSQTIDPPTGLTLIPVDGVTFYDEDLNGRVYEDADQLISATQPGDYTVTTTVTAVGTGQEFSKQTKVKVYAMEEPFVEAILHVGARLLPVNQGSTPTPVSVELREEDVDLVTDVTLKILETGQEFALLEEPRENPESIVRNFSKTIAIDTSQSDRCFTYIAFVNTPKGPVQSRNQDRVCITEFPLYNYSPPRPTLWQSLTGTQYAKNLIMIYLKEDVSNPEHVIKQIANTINGRVVGQGSGYQIEVSNPPDIHDGFLRYYSDKLRDFPQIDTLELYYKSAMVLSASDDPEFLAGNQHYLDTIRADEAWYVTGQNPPVVAVVDTGIQVTHEDLAGKLIDPLNVVPTDLLSHYTDSADIEDLNSHGTHVAGIIGAVTNNSLGIAGISRNNQIMPIRAGLALRSGFYSKLLNISDPIYWDDVVTGIHAAVAKKTKIINVSIGVPETLDDAGLEKCLNHFADRGPDACDIEKAKTKLCAAVAAAKKKKLIVVAAAGNDGVNMQMYPAVCDDAIAVGATDESGEARWIGATQASNFGE
jgi:hypothetical protein